MKGLGLIVRADNRGLGRQTHSLYRMLEPEKVLILDDARAMPDVERYFDRYPHSATVAPDPIQPRVLQNFIEGLDLLLSCETFYFDDAPTLCNDLGVKTALQFNYEFCRWAFISTLPKPDLLIAPSEWNIHKLPFQCPVLPPPIHREDFPFRLRTEARKFVHVVGRPAFSDRAGTRMIIDALPHITENIELTIRSQVPMHHVSEQVGNVSLKVVYEDTPDPKELYEEYDVLLAPRRYGGLSLPLVEACSMGLPVLALNRIPEKNILSTESLLPARRTGTFSLTGLEVGIYSGRASALAKRIDYLVTHPELVSRLSQHADQYADSVSSEALKPHWLNLLEEGANEGSLLR